MLKLGFLTITGCSFWNIFFPPRGGLGPKGCVGRMLMILTLFGFFRHQNLLAEWFLPSLRLPEEILANKTRK